MGEHNKVVVRYQNGDVLKGTTQDFFPNRPLFHLQPQAGGEAREIRTNELKAVFFVKDFAGHPERQDVPGFLAAPGTVNQGRKVAVRFKDGEMICGYSVTFMPGRDGFFVFPADAEGNNLRIYVLAAATSDVKVGPAAEALVRSMIQGPHAA
jgi:hypothetical protein